MNDGTSGIDKATVTIDDTNTTIIDINITTSMDVVSGDDEDINTDSDVDTTTRLATNPINNKSTRHSSLEECAPSFTKTF